MFPLSLGSLSAFGFSLSVFGFFHLCLWIHAKKSSGKRIYRRKTKAGGHLKTPGATSHRPSPPLKKRPRPRGLPRQPAPPAPPAQSSWCYPFLPRPPRYMCIHICTYCIIAVIAASTKLVVVLLARPLGTPADHDALAICVKLGAHARLVPEGAHRVDEMMLAQDSPQHLTSRHLRPRDQSGILLEMTRRVWESVLPPPSLPPRAQSRDRP